MNMDMRHLAAMLVPCLVKAEQKEHSLPVASDSLRYAEAAKRFF
jgi:hypothetical protein